jgi:AraC-like DNA-binding protein
MDPGCAQPGDPVLYVLLMVSAARAAVREVVRAWRPGVPGVAEVFHARFVSHAYPAHTHDTWTLLIVDDGAIRYELEQHHHGAVGATVTLLPPHVPHDGRAASHEGFRKRVLYLDTSVLDLDLVGAAADHPALRDDLLRDRIHRLHAVLAHDGDTFEAESRLALVCARLRSHLDQPSVVDDAALDGASPAPLDFPAALAFLADRFRQLLDARTVNGITLREASAELGASPGHLVRSFTRTFGLPPHLYLTGRRVDHARRLLLAGQPAASVAATVGFHDQSHMTRHFRRHLGATPSRWKGTPR